MEKQFKYTNKVINKNVCKTQHVYRFLTSKDLMGQGCSLEGRGGGY